MRMFSKNIYTLNFQPFKYYSWMPSLRSGNIPLPEEWQQLVTRVEHFYEEVDREWIIKQNEDYRCRWDRKERVTFYKPEDPEDDCGWIYILRAGHYYKIGRTKDIRQRFGALSAIPPFPTEIVHVFKSVCMHQDEAELHEQFSDKRCAGEWFALTPDDVTYLQGFSVEVPYLEVPDWEEPD